MNIDRFVIGMCRATTDDRPVDFPDRGTDHPLAGGITQGPNVQLSLRTRAKERTTAGGTELAMVLA